MTRRARLALDVGLFAGFGLAFAPGLTGISIHEWLSLAIVVPSLVHLIINWDWVMRVSTRLLGKIKMASKLNLGVDTLLFGSTVTVMLSGLMVSHVISAAVGVSRAAGGLWSAVHSLSAIATIVLLVFHLGLHIAWISRTVRGVTASPAELAEVSA